MKTIFSSAALILALALVMQGEAQDKDKKPVGALPPHKLDGAFEKAKTEKAIMEDLMKNDLFKKAVAEALKAKQKREKEMVENPKILSATPSQAARQKFLEIIRDEAK